MANLTDRYLSQLQALLPQGLAWPTDPDAELTQYLANLAGWMSAVDARASQLMIEADPRKTSELIDDWEESLGLPDACAVGVQAIEDRRAAIVAKMLDAGGARISRFVALAKALGYEGATTKRFKPFTCRSACNETLWTDEARFVWQLVLQNGPAIQFMTVGSRCNEPIRRWGDAVLECVIQRENPAMTDVLFNYGAT